MTMTKYKAVSPLKGKISQDVDQYDATNQDIKDNFNTLMQMLESDGYNENLANYIRDESDLDGLVKSIKVTAEIINDQVMGVAYVECYKPLSKKQLVQLREYISGQYSDGWGEGFEQQDICQWEEPVEVEEWSEEDQEYFMEEYDMITSLSVSYWFSSKEGWHMEIYNEDNIKVL